MARLMLICRVHEANRLRAELSVARMAEKAAREKYQDFMRTSSMYGVSVSDSVSAIQIRDIFTVIQIVLYSWLKDQTFIYRWETRTAVVYSSKW